MGRKKGIPGVSFSWKRALGITAAKNKIARGSGIPLTRAGRQRKVGKAMGCCAPAIMILAGAGGAIYGIGRVLIA